MFRPSFALAMAAAALSSGTPLSAQRPRQDMEFDLMVLGALSARSGGAPHSRRNRDRSKYRKPHQGAREMARRAKALAKT